MKVNTICKHCGFTFGSHLFTGYYSNWNKSYFPQSCCPGHEGRMDWDQGPGTTFEPKEVSDVSST